ncbi:ABC transporter [Favolaschia claudopus]|uniref:ABC transporter n=1 Tax=Favolaschia claudopus TaxID=2862362 RepID=A0AAV9ZZY1_9AGAR
MSDSPPHPPIELEDAEKSGNPEGSVPELEVRLTPSQLVAVFIAFMVSFALTALDQTILSTALPTIASHFNAISDLSWIPSAYFLPQAGLMLFYGRILAIAPAKIILLTVVVIFELGSLLCAIAPSVNILIFGRVVAGIGASGLMVSVLYIIAKVTTIRQRPIFIGVFGGVYAIASVVGPLIGGVFSDRVSWRWCFYINLPIGGAAIALIIVFLPAMRPLDSDHAQSWLSLDWVGVILSVGMITLFLVPIQRGGNVKPWDSAEIVSLLVLSALFLAAFITWEAKKGNSAMLPLYMFKRRNMLGSCLEGFFINICFVLASYYLPFIYQLRGHSPMRSGIDIIPFMIAGTLAALFSGICIAKFGRAWPFLFGGPLVGAVASGLLFTVSGTTTTARIIGFQIIFGVGLGVALQNTMVVVQAEFAAEQTMLSRATSVVTFVQTLGASTGLAISGAIFSSQLKHRLNNISDLDPDSVATALSSVEAVFFFPPTLRVQILSGYIHAVDSVFILSLVAAVLGSVGSLVIQRGKVENLAPLTEYETTSST